MEDYKKMQKYKGKKLLDGKAASPGIAVGTVRNVQDQEQAPELIAKIKQGEIVVADKLKVDLVTMCGNKAAAFVTNTGGILATGATIAREFKIPVITGTISKGKQATQILKTGQRVVVDGTEGAVYMYAKAKSSRASQKKIHD